MSTFHVTFTNLGSLRKQGRRWERNHNQYPGHVTALANKVSDIYEKELKREAPYDHDRDAYYPRRGGKHLRDDISVHVTGGYEDLVVKPETTVKHLVFVLNDTKAHPIRAINVPLLHFFWKKYGGWVFFESVQHPGTKANKFDQRALVATRSRTNPHLVTFVQKVTAP